jgi:hypothetical protein
VVAREAALGGQSVPGAEPVGRDVGGDGVGQRSVVLHDCSEFIVESIPY